MTELASVRTLVVHDWIVPWGGAERVLGEIMALVPHANLIVGVRHPARNQGDLTRRARETWVANVPFARTHHRWFVPLHFGAFRGLDTRGYDLVISSSFGFAKAVMPTGNTPHVCYCHSPPRYVWDMNETYRALAGPLRGAALAIATPLLRALDRRSAYGVTQFVSNSRFVARRIAAAYGRDAVVVHPPVERKPVGASPPVREDFLLVLGRLVAYKRVDLAIRAAERLGKRLVVAGDGPERAKLERLAGRHVTFVGEVNDEAAGALLERCAAFLFCAEEDFGIAPVEANAHGAPVVGYGAGGLLESMVDGETAVFFERQTVDAVSQAVMQCLSRPWDRERLRANAERFTSEHFRERFGAVLRDAVSGATRSARA